MGDNPYPWSFSWESPERTVQDKANGAKGAGARKPKPTQKSRTNEALDALYAARDADSSKRVADLRKANKKKK